MGLIISNLGLGFKEHQHFGFGLYGVSASWVWGSRSISILNLRFKEYQHFGCWVSGVAAFWVWGLRGISILGLGFKEYPHFGFISISWLGRVGCLNG